MKYNETIESAIVTWVKAITGLECVAEQQKYRGTVTGSFCSYNILAPIKYGQDDMWSDDDTPDKFNFHGQRSLPVKVTIYADNALYLGELLSQSLEKPTQRESFEASGFSILRNEGLQDISATLETGFEKRCQLSIIINTAVSYDDTVGYIDTVEGEGTVKDVNGDTILVEEFEINK